MRARRQIAADQAKPRTTAKPATPADDGTGSPGNTVYDGREELLTLREVVDEGADGPLLRTLRTGRGA